MSTDTERAERERLADFVDQLKAWAVHGIIPEASCVPSLDRIAHLLRTPEPSGEVVAWAVRYPDGYVEVTQHPVIAKQMATDGLVGFMHGGDGTVRPLTYADGAEPSGWRPVEEATGGPVLGWNGFEVAMLVQNPPFGWSNGWCYEDDGERIVPQPTHWMPLPTPPSGEKG